MLERICADDRSARAARPHLQGQVRGSQPGVRREGPAWPGPSRTYSAICPGLGGGTPGLPERSSLSFRPMDRK